MPLWPRLSETLDTSSVLKCQRCGAPTSLVRWQECDDKDRAEMVFIVLCETCSGQVIEIHPRLYRDLMRDEIAPGAMSICEECPHRKGPRCTFPGAKFNGGEGMYFHPPPQRIHLCRAKNSGWKVMQLEPITHCSGKAE